jgi:hypothetical protein
VRGEGTKLGEGKGTKLGEGCPKVRLSQDRMPMLFPSPRLAIFPQIKLGEGEGTMLGEGKRD